MKTDLQREIIKKRILELTASTYPSRFRTMLEEALLAVKDREQQSQLCTVACLVSNIAWQKWISSKVPEDNRQEHEWVVFAHVMKIAEAENLTISEKRIATAFSFLHDTIFIRRIMEEEIRAAEQAGRVEEAKELRIRKKRQRYDHMAGGAANAARLLPTLIGPTAAPGEPLFTNTEIDRCVRIIAEHDAWKVDPPLPPPTNDRLFLACVEADVLWPLHPLGVLADLERPNELGATKDVYDPVVWHDQIQQSNKTILEYRAKWQGIPSGDFFDAVSIFRTREGWRLYDDWCTRWGV
jgi:hypothetical protein